MEIPRLTLKKGDKLLCISNVTPPNARYKLKVCELYTFDRDIKVMIKMENDEIIHHLIVVKEINDGVFLDNFITPKKLRYKNILKLKEIINKKRMKSNEKIKVY